MSTTENALEQAYPLQWPPAWPRAKEKERARFKTTFDKARRELMRELGNKDFKATRIILSTNLPLRKDGAPYATARVGADTGVAIYFERKGKRLVFACDRWDKIEDNMQAVMHSIAALRGIERWGASDMLERAFTGFAALPAPDSPHWTAVLGVTGKTDLPEVEDMYRRKMKNAHPDMGGSHEMATKLNKAIAEARAAHGS